MAGRSGIVVIILAFAALGILLSVSTTSSKKEFAINYPLPDSLQPKLSQEQALQVAEREMQIKLGSLEGVRVQIGLYNYSKQGHNNFENPYYLAYLTTNNLAHGWPLARVHQHPELLNFPLIYIQRNGTEYSINATSHEAIKQGCNVIKENCSLFRPSAIAAEGHLFYALILTLDKPFNGFEETGYLIDAANGQVIWNSMDYEFNKSSNK